MANITEQLKEVITDICLSLSKDMGNAQAALVGEQHLRNMLLREIDNSLIYYLTNEELQRINSNPDNLTQAEHVAFKFSYLKTKLNRQENYYTESISNLQKSLKDKEEEMRLIKQALINIDIQMNGKATKLKLADKLGDIVNTVTLNLSTLFAAYTSHLQTCGVDEKSMATILEPISKIIEPYHIMFPNPAILPKLIACILDLAEKNTINNDSGLKWRDVCTLPRKHKLVLVMYSRPGGIIKYKSSRWTGAKWTYVNKPFRVLRWTELPSIPTFEEYNTAKSKTTGRKGAKHDR